MQTAVDQWNNKMLEIYHETTEEFIYKQVTKYSIKFGLETIESEELYYYMHIRIRVILPVDNIETENENGMLPNLPHKQFYLD